MMRTGAGSRPDSRGPDAVLVLTSVSDEVSGRRLSATLVEEGVAACITRMPVGSTYRWEGKVVDEAEVLLLIKTAASRWPALRRRILELHPYDVPEVIRVNIDDGSPAWLAWLGAAVLPNSGD